MPSSKEWEKSMGKSVRVAALVRVKDLIAEYEALQTGDRDTTRGRRGAVGAQSEPSEQEALQLFIQFQIERGCRFVIKVVDKYDSEAQQQKIGKKLGEEKLKAVRRLHQFVFDEIKKTIGATDVDYETKIIEEFGKKVLPKEVQADQELLAKNMLSYFDTPFSQKRLKLSFRNGLTWRWIFNDKNKTHQLEPYDTRSFGDENYSECGASLYVMDGNGAIYVLGKEEDLKKLNHSSLLAGAGVLCAGTIRIENGQVIWLTGKSGHYRPTVDQIVSVLERLRQYQVDLTKVLVFREDFTTGFVEPANSPGKHFDSCDAVTLLRDRLWPVSGNKDRKAMRVG
jgi:hypothetical protein